MKQKQRIGFLAALLATASPAQAATFAANAVSFQDITGGVEITTTSGDEMDIAVRQGNVYRTIAIEERDGVVTISGEKQRLEDNRDCCNTRINRTFDGRKDRTAKTGEPVDEAFFADYPTIVVSMPYKGDVEFIDARVKLKMDRLGGRLALDACYVYGEASDVEEAVIGLVHGSRFVMGNVAAGLEIDISGDADFLAGDADMVDIDIAGPGEVVLGDVSGMFDVSIAGSGHVRVNYVDAPVTARIAGSGAVAVKDGRADRLRVSIDGSGGVYFGGIANQPDLRLYGSSEVRLEKTAGRMTRSGGGDVYIAGAKISRP